MSRLETIGASNWREFVAAGTAVVLLGRSDCENCARFTADLEAFLASDAEFPSVRFGKMLLDTPGLGDFKRANPWLADLEDLPYTLIYREGEKVKEFAGGVVDRLVSRLRRLGGEPPVG